MTDRKMTELRRLAPQMPENQRGELEHHLSSIPGVRALAEEAWDASRRYWDPATNLGDAVELLLVMGGSLESVRMPFPSTVGKVVVDVNPAIQIQCAVGSAGWAAATRRAIVEAAIRRADMYQTPSPITVT